MNDEKMICGFSVATLWGIFWSAVSVLCWSSLFVVVSFIIKRGKVDPYTLVQVRFVSAGLIMLLASQFLLKKNVFAGIGKKDWFLLVFHGIFAAGMSICLFVAQNMKIPVVNASMLESESPLAIFILGIIFLRNRTSFLQIAGLLLGFAGSMFVLKIVSAEGLQIKSFSPGDFMVFAGAVFWAVYTILARKSVRKLGGFLYTAWTLLFAGLWTLVWQLITRETMNYPMEFPDIFWTLYLGLIPTALAFFSWNNAQKYISTGLLAVSGYFTPIFSAFLAAWLFRENITLCQFGGMILVFGSSLIEPEIAEGLRNFCRSRFRS